MFVVVLLALAAGGYVAYTHPEVLQNPTQSQEKRLEREYVVPLEPNGQGDKALHALWDKPSWHPNQWDKEAYSTENMLNGFLESGIIYNAYIDRSTPVVKVGPNFYHLSNQDKTNVMAYLNKAYGITDRAGMFLIKDWRSGKTIGNYGRDGLHLN
jgi:hypothetical protein